jgi:phosphoenolpyruvate carboxykinase (GTP)
MPGTSALEAWVDECARLTHPQDIVWCDGTEEEYRKLVDRMVREGTMERLNASAYPNSFLYRSDPNDVARTEHLTYICTQRKEDAGPTNNWMDPQAAKEAVRPLFEGAMEGRTMYVVPYLMGPTGSPHAKVGVEITDSAYVALSIRITARMGGTALDHLAGNGGEFIPGLHSVGDLDPTRRFILHFTEERLIWSVGSGYGGNALLGKKCLSLRLASWMGRQEGWMAEHMLVLGL